MENKLEKFEKIKALVESIEVDVEKFYQKGNSVAGVRVRKAMQDLKVFAQELREDIQNIKNQK